MRLRTRTKITDQDRHSFTMGYCHVLALAIHEKYGWPVYGFLDLSDDLPDVHAFVQSPDGLFVDVTGAWTAEQITEQWASFFTDTDNCQWAVLGQVKSPHAAFTDWDDGHGAASVPYMYRRAKTVARLVVDEWQKQQEGLLDQN